LAPAGVYYAYGGKAYMNGGTAVDGKNGTIIIKASCLDRSGATFSPDLMSPLSNSGGCTWQYSKDLMIANPGATLTDYQVLVNLTGAGFPIEANASGADIRFTDAGGAELNYWIENWDYANRSANVWVNVTSIPAGVSSMHLWYGNPGATSSSNGNATFVFFDDFESGNLNKWDGVDPGMSVVSDNSNNVLRLYHADNGPWTSIWKNIVPTDIRVDLKYKIVQDGGWDGARFVSSLRFSNLSQSYSYILADWHFRALGPLRSLHDNLTDVPVVLQPISYYSTLGVWYYWGFSVVGSSSVLLNGYGKDGEVLVSYTDTAKLHPSGQLRLWILDTGATDYIDNVRVRKYASAEPFIVYNLSGRVLNSSSGLGIPGALVKLDAYPQYNATTNISGDYSMSVPSGIYNITASFEPTYYTNSTTVLIESSDVVAQDIALVMKPTGAITGSVKNA